MAASNHRPEFVTNQNGNTVAEALRNMLQHLQNVLSIPYEVAIATAYFNPSGFDLIADGLESAGGVRLLLGTEPQNPLRKVRSLSGGLPPQQQGQEELRTALENHDSDIKENRDLLGFTYESDKKAQRLIQWLHSDKVKVRLLQDRFLHGKAFIIDTNNHGVVAGSSNFTAGGLTRNLELNLGQYQPYVVEQVQAWYDSLWDQADPFDLAAIYEERYAPHSPYLIYLKMLYERYGAEVEAEAEDQSTGIRLTQFQEDGLWRARKMLDKHDGVIIADGVGLGKTFIAGELIREAREDRRQRVLLVAPATLRDGPWRSFLDNQQLYVECVSYQELAQSPQVNPEASGRGLKQDIDDYAMVVIDEAHAYRNSDTLRAESLRRLLQGAPAKDVIMLTATPVNNSLWDLYNLISYFIPNDSAFADAGITSLREYFKSAMDQDPDSLSPEQLFDVLDEIVVRRTRHFVKRYYPNETIPVDGEEVKIAFPEPSVRGVEYAFKETLPGFFDEFASALDYDPDGETPEKRQGLTLARYMPSRYDGEEDTENYEVQVAGLLRSGLLKRFESSVHAFANTCRTMAESHQEFLRFLDEGFVVSGDALRDWIATDTDEIDSVIGEIDDKVPANTYNTPALRRDVEQDRSLLLSFADRARQVSRTEDPKLRCLTSQLEQIVEEAERQSLSGEDARQRRKVLIFSYYADTVEWIKTHLERVCAERDPLHVYDGRIAATTGQSGNRDAVLFGFAPISSEAPPGRNEDRFDIVVATDVLAEGVNLQQVRHIINYDLPWNPMRLVQRHGRIDRIGSPHDRVYVRCIFPDSDLEELLNLEERLQGKISQAAASIGVESEVIPGSEVSDLSFTRTREEISRLREGEANLFETAGETGNAYSGEEYRQALRSGLAQPELADKIKGLPWGSGSGKAVVGAEPGFVFCARVADHDRPLFRYVPLQESASGIVRDTLSCLAHAHSTAGEGRTLPDKMKSEAYKAWEIAREDIFKRWQRATDPRNLQPKIPKAMRQAATLIRNNPPSDVEQPVINRYLDAIEAPYGNRIVREFRDIVRSYDRETSESAGQTVRRLLEKADQFGLEPSDPLEPLVPIGQENIHLVCWIAIVSEETSSEYTASRGVL